MASWKTAVNTNLYIEEEVNGEIPPNPAPQSLRWVSNGLEGSDEEVVNDTKLPGRNPSKSFKGTSSNAGDLVVNFAPLEHEDFLKAVTCSEDGFVKNTGLSDAAYNVYDMVIGNKQRSFYLLKEFTQDPKLYQLFRGLQFNTLNISFQISSLVKLTFALMGANNPGFVETNPISLAGKKDAFTTEEFITLEGSAKFKGPDDPVPVEYIDFTDISIDISNNMADLQGLFQQEAIDKTIGMLDITGSISEYVKDGKLYNLAKQGKGGELHITVFNDDAEYAFILKINFDNSTLSGDDQLSTAIPFKTYGEDRFIIRKKIPTIPVTGVSLDQNSLTMNVSDVETLIATISPANASNQDVTWNSDDGSVATVDQGGNVLAIGAGSCNITVTTDDGSFTDVCVVTVS
jgi:hypothetical protein